MDWRILVFYPEPEARDKFTNIRQLMLKLKHILASMIFFDSDNPSRMISVLRALND
jgi:hypothetical protein